jgi:cellulose synthase/poly-beta-1,6-N-acetylglucosamine synthase-like glycosyltransferase
MTMFALASGPVGGIQELSLLLSGIFIAYVIFVLLPFTRRRTTEVGDSQNFQWHALVPCRDEEAVIGETIAGFHQDFPSIHLWVIDDGSTDGTAAVVESLADDSRVHLVQRRLPEARTGKGDALNAGYRALREWLGGDVDPTDVIVVVIDADGRLSSNALDVMAGPVMFGDPSIGGAQVEVRMINRDDARPWPNHGRVRNFFGRTLVRMQDLEFRSVISAMQHSRTHLTRTTGLGGNGQFTRLSALESIDQGDGRAWRGSLLEDFELGIHLMLAGWKNSFTDTAWVDQEALASYRRYLTQRTRWGQGVMQCRRYLFEIWGSQQIGSLGAMEMTYYLAQPWMALVGTILFPLTFVLFMVTVALAPGGILGFTEHAGWGLLLLYAVFGLGPFVVWGELYRRKCEPDRSFLTGLGWGLAYVVYVYGFYLTSWRALARIARGQHGWAKTRRNAEVEMVGPVALDH